MTALTLPDGLIPATTGDALEKVNAIEGRMRWLYAGHAAPDETVTEHLLHGGMYARTVRAKARQAFCSVTIRPPSVLIVRGKAAIFTGMKCYRIDGYRVIAAGAGRKAIWVIEEDTDITAIFPCLAETVEEAEREFTTETEKLSALCSRDVVTITGVKPCRE